MWATRADGSGPEAVEDVLRAGAADGGITRLRWYYLCPDVLTEVGDALGVPVRTYGHLV
jgi:RNA polymerase sigma-70 factor, ECF subfamily